MKSIFQRLRSSFGLGGKFTEVSLERLMRFLTALGCHIEIKIGARQEDKAGDVTIKDVRRTAA